MADYPRDRQLKLTFVALDETIDVFTAARMARVSPESMRRWCDQGIVVAYKLVGRWRIDREAFYTWLQAHRITCLSK
jgi:hypothetical protein